MDFGFVIWAVGMGILCGGTSAFLFLRWLDRRMSRIKSTEGRTYQDKAKFDNTALHRDDEVGRGGAMGYPATRIGEESLRMSPAHSDYLVCRQDGSTLIARLTVGSRHTADLVFSTLARQMESKGRLPVIGDHAHDSGTKKNELEVVLKFEEGDRRLAILRSGSEVKVVEFARRTIRSVARTVDVDDARELFALILEQSPEALAAKQSEPSSEPDLVIDPPVLAKCEPSTGGSLSELTVTTTCLDIEPTEDHETDPLWNQLFN